MIITRSTVHHIVGMRGGHQAHYRVSIQKVTSCGLESLPSVLIISPKLTAT